ncbi:MAG TPA: hypothetical protein VGE14_15275 [Marmoricola sp.]
MFANVCTRCGKRDLVYVDQIRELRQTADGFDVRYECACGASVTWHAVREGVRVVAA